MTHRGLARSAARLGAVSVVALLGACASPRSAGAGPTPPGAAAPAPGWTRESFPVLAHGELSVALPPGWSRASGEAAEAGTPTVRLVRADARFLALVTPLWNPGEPETPQARADTARLLAELARRKALAGAVETELALEEVIASGVAGFWFSATDRDLVRREPRPDEWRHVLQGVAAVGPLIVAFTLLDDGPGPQREELLELVRSARFVADGEPRAEAPEGLDPIPEDRTSPLRVGWPAARWALLVDLPGFRLGARRDGAGRGPYVLGLEPRTGIAASVSLAPAGAARDAAGCREQALAAIAVAVPEAAKAARASDGPSARLSYALAGGAAAARELHAHAFLFREGSCADVHVSKIGPDAADSARLDEILASARIVEDL